MNKEPHIAPDGPLAAYRSDARTRIGLVMILLITLVVGIVIAIRTAA